MSQKKPDHINTSVPLDTWNTAQVWERSFWIREQRNLARYGKNYIWKMLSILRIVEHYRGDDDNRWWATMFQNYHFLPKSVENMIEVGCGPYTNVRLIRQACKPNHLFLSDPLIRTYVTFKMTMVRELYKQTGCYLDDHPLEQLPFRDSYFDVAIMINVLDHVQNAEVCMTELTRLIKTGGYVIIGQDLTDEEDYLSHPEGMRTGHPITLDEEWFRPHLAAFRPVIRKVLSREEGRTPQWHSGTFLFAGVKL